VATTLTAREQRNHPAVCEGFRRQGRARDAASLRAVSTIDVVVVSYNSRDTLRRCVEPLCRAEDVEVIVVDNASADGSLSSVADLPVTAVPLDTNLGFAHGCNTGWRRGSGSYVLFLNPDAHIDPISVRRLALVLDESADVGIAGPRIVDDDGCLEPSIRRFSRLSSTYAQALFLHRIWPRALWADEVVRVKGAYETSGSAEWLSGACLLVRRSLLEALRGFDESFFMYCEDQDLCWRSWNAGAAVQFEPGAEAVHMEGGGRSRPRGELLPVLAASRIRLVRKHRGRRHALGERAGIVLGSVTHALIGRRRGARRGHARALLTALTRT
jgi:N-acetylglucosaminyl-diphospho-decaprenol L-rhamnosyltransferase